MNAREVLKSAIALNESGDHKAALRKLERLRAKAPHQPRVVYEAAIAQLGLDNEQAAVKLLEQLHFLEPDRERGWLLHADLLHEQPEQAIAVLDRALRHLPDQHDLRMQRCYNKLLLRDWSAGSQLLAELEADNQGESLSEFANLAVSAAYTDSEQRPDDEPVVEDVFGAACFVQPLELAERALGQLLEGQQGKWHHWYQLGEVRQRLQRFEAASQSFSEALARLGPDDQAMGEMIKQSIADCANNGKGQRQRVADMMRDAVREGTSEAERRRPDFRMAEQMVESAAEHIEFGASLAEAADEFLDDSDPDKPVVISIAREILGSISVGEPRFDMARPEIFPRSAQKHCDRCKQELRQHEFRHLGDFMPRHLEEIVGNPTLMRVMISPDKTINAACYQVFPRRPVWWQWLLLLVLRKWKTPKVIDLQTELSDGRFVVTNNAGSMDPFDHGSDILLTKLEPDADADTLLHVHSHAVADALTESPGVEARALRTIDQIAASESRQQAIKRRHRQSIGLASEVELKTLLGPQYPRFGDKVRQYLDVLSERTATS